MKHKVDKFYNLFENYQIPKSSCSFLLKRSTSFPLKRNQHACSNKHSNMANLFHFKLLPVHHIFLLLVLSFSSTPTFADPVKFCYDNEQLWRQLRLRKYFLSNGDANKPPVYNHRSVSRWTQPNSRNTFIALIFNKFREQNNNFISNTPHTAKHTLPMQQQSGLRKLSNNINIKQT